MLKFKINDDGSLSTDRIFALLNLLVKDKNKSWWLALIGMKIEQQG